MNKISFFVILKLNHSMQSSFTLIILKKVARIFNKSHFVFHGKLYESHEAKQIYFLSELFL